MKSYTIVQTAAIRRTMETMRPSEVIFINEAQFRTYKHAAHRHWRTRVFTSKRTPCGTYRGILKLRAGTPFEDTRYTTHRAR